jgi:hypothetical protein
MSQVIVYILFALLFSIIASSVRLPSGYRIGVFTAQVSCLIPLSARLTRIWTRSDGLRH